MEDFDNTDIRKLYMYNWLYHIVCLHPSPVSMTPTAITIVMAPTVLAGNYAWKTFLLITVCIVTILSPSGLLGNLSEPAPGKII